MGGPVCAGCGLTALEAGDQARGRLGAPCAVLPTPRHVHLPARHGLREASPRRTHCVCTRGNASGWPEGVCGLQTYFVWIVGLFFQKNFPFWSNI